jgi:hypothetical protein
VKHFNRGKQMLQTSVTGFEYSFVHHTGRLYMPRGCCCDMTDCVNFFRKIDPDVEAIRTFAGIEEDTAYQRHDGKWRASHKGSRWEACEIPEKEPRPNVL